MPRNRYTKAIQEYQQTWKTRQDKELAAVAANLRGQDAQSLEIPPTNKMKERRSARLEQKRRYKAKRRGGTADIDQK